MEMLCKFCERKCKNANSLRNHERLCKENPDRQILVSNFIAYNQKRKLEGIPGMNHFIKAKLEGRVIEITDEYRKKISDSRKGRILTEETKRNISLGMQKAVRENPDSYSSSNVNGRFKRTFYNGVWLDSNWEFIFATWCDENSIVWEKNKISFEYEWNGNRLYYPDFYLSEFDIFVEIKGFERERDRIKWTVVPNLIVLKKKEIENIMKGKFHT